MHPHIAQPLPGSLQKKQFTIKKRCASLFLPASAALIFIMACGTIRTLEHAPASIIYLSIQIQHQYTTTPQVTLYASFSDATGHFRLSGNQAFTCDGVTPPQDPLGFISILLNRQPPGGAYHCIYTDDQGKKSPVTVPVPQGSLAITSPAPGAVVSIPGNAQAPTPEGTSTPVPHTPESAGSLTIDYTLPALPSGATKALNVSAQCGSVAAPTACGVVSGNIPPGPEGLQAEATYFPI